MLWLYEFESQANPIKFQQLILHTTKNKSKAEEISIEKSLLERCKGERIFKNTRMDLTPRDCGPSNRSELQ